MNRELEPDSQDNASYWRGLAAGTFWTAAGYGTRYSFQAAASIVTARLLGAAVFGEYGMITSTVALLGTVADLGMSASAARFVGAYRTSEPVRAARSLNLSVLTTTMMACIAGALLALLAPHIAERLLSNSRLTFALQLSALAVAFTAVGSVLSGGLRGLGRFRDVALTEITLGAVSAISMVVGAWLGSLEGAVSGVVISSGLRMIGFLLLTRSRVTAMGWTLSIRGAYREAREILGFAVPAFAGGLLVTPVMWGVRAILANTPNGYAELGTFSAAFQWQSMIVAVASIQGVVLLPSLAEQFQLRDRNRLLSTFRNGFGILIGTELIITVILLLSSDPIVALYGRDFQSLGRTLPVVMIAGFLNAVLTLPGQVLAAVNRMWVGFALNVIWAITFLLTAALSAPEFGAVGVAIAYLAAYLVHSVTSMGALVILLGRQALRTTIALLVASLTALVSIAMGTSVTSWLIALGGLAYVAFQVRVHAKLLLEAYGSVRLRPIVRDTD